MSKKICTPFVVYFVLCGNPKVDLRPALLVDHPTWTLNLIWVVNEMTLLMSSHQRNVRLDSKLVQDETVLVTARVLETLMRVSTAHLRRQQLRRVRE
jgi:hypothetical protein